MSGTRSKRNGRHIPAELALYARQIARDNTREHDRLHRNLTRAMREELTDKQRQVIALYYSQDLTMEQIAARLGVNRSTVCRTLHRGERRLFRCLRYGATTYLKAMDEEDDPCQ